jgi:hypothetical protein
VEEGYWVGIDRAFWHVLSTISIVDCRGLCQGGFYGALGWVEQ